LTGTGETLRQHPSVFDAAVVGVPDPVRDQSIKAFMIVKESTTTVEELIEWRRKRLSAFKVPETVEFRATFPRTSVGKDPEASLLNTDPRDAKWLV
jgi:carnitine-CoA ligase